MGQSPRDSLYSGIVDSSNDLSKRTHGCYQFFARCFVTMKLLAGVEIYFCKRKSFSNSERRSGKGVNEVVIQIWVCLWQDASLQNTLCFWFPCISHCASCWAGRVFNQIAMVQNESAKFGDFDADKNRSCRMNHFRGTRYQACLHTSRVGCPYSIPQVLICVCIIVLLYIHAYIYIYHSISIYIYIRFYA